MHVSAVCVLPGAEQPRSATCQQKQSRKSKPFWCAIMTAHHRTAMISWSRSLTGQQHWTCFRWDSGVGSLLNRDAEESGQPFVHWSLVSDTTTASLHEANTATLYCVVLFSDQIQSLKSKQNWKITLPDNTKRIFKIYPTVFQGYDNQSFSFLEDRFKTWCPILKCTFRLWSHGKMHTFWL